MGRNHACASPITRAKTGPCWWCHWASLWKPGRPRGDGWQSEAAVLEQLLDYALIFPSVTTIRLIPPPRTCWLEPLDTGLLWRSRNARVAPGFLGFEVVVRFLGVLSGRSADSQPLKR